MREAELERIACQRRHRGDDSPELVGLALSGGGIRSASFALGVLQALDRYDLLRRVDYLSTVSGGGYIGSALTWFMRKGRRGFPFGTKGLGVRSGPDAGGEETEEPSPNAILGFIRQHGSYLSPRTAFSFTSREGEGGRRGGKTAGIGTGSLVAVVLRNMLLCLLVYGSLLVALFGALILAGKPLSNCLGGLGYWKLACLPPATLAALALAAIPAGIFLLLSLVYPVVTLVLHFGTASADKDNLFARYAYRARLCSQSLTGRLLFCLGLFLVLASVPWVGDELPGWGAREGWLGALATIGGAVVGLLRFRSDLGGAGQKDGTASRGLRAAAPPVAAFLLIYGLLLLSHRVAELRPGMWILLLLGAALLVGFSFGINYIGVNRLYRDRLMETFLPSDDAVRANEWRPAREADLTRLHLSLIHI